MLKDPLKYVETAYELLDLADTHQHPITKNLKYEMLMFID